MSDINETRVSDALAASFASRDLTAAEVRDAQGNFLHYDHDLLVDEATAFLADGHGPAMLPTPRALVRDFLTRRSNQASAEGDHDISLVRVAPEGYLT